MCSTPTRRPKPPDPLSAAHAAARELGVDPHSLRRQAQGSTSAVFVGAAVVCIVAPSYAAAATVTAQVALAAALADRAAFVRPLWPAPRRFAGCVVSAWERVQERAGPLDWESAGAAVRSLHSVGIDEVERRAAIRLRSVADCGDALAGVDRLAGRGRLRPRAAANLRAVARRLDRELAGLDPRRGLVHGDLHRPNLLNGHEGVLICDTDEIAVGAPTYDLGFLTDPARPSLPPRARAAFEAGYGEALPGPDVARSFARAAHLRRTLTVLDRPATVRERYFDAARLGAWSAMVARWDRDLVPVVAQPRVTQGGLAVRGLPGLGR